MLSPASSRPQGADKAPARNSLGTRDAEASARCGGAVRERLSHRPGPGDDRLAIRYDGTALAGGDAILLLGQASATHATGSAVDFGAVFSAGAAGYRDDLGDILLHGADLVVVIDEGGRLLWANDAFLDAAAVSRVTGVEGRFLEDLLAWRGAGDVESLVEQAGGAGFSGPVAALLRRDAGEDLPVTIGVTRMPRRGRRACSGEHPAGCRGRHGHAR